MGMFDEYDGVQLKVGPRTCHCYNIGDSVPIKDGVYVGWTGFVVIIGGKLSQTFGHINTKYDFEEPVSAERTLLGVYKLGVNNQRFIFKRQFKPRKHKPITWGTAGEWAIVQDTLNEIETDRPPVRLISENKWCLVRGDSRELPIEQQVINFFLPGWAIELSPNGTWHIQGDCEGE